MNIFSSEIKNFLKQPDNISLLLLIIILPCLILGPFFPDLFAVIISLIFIFQMNKKKINILNSNYVIFFLLFYSLIIFSSVSSIYWEGSLKSSITFIRFLFFGIAIHWIILKNEKFFFKNLQIILLATIGLLFFDSVIQFFFHVNLLGMEIIDTGGAYVRVSSFFGDEQILGSYIARCSPIFLYVFLNNKLNRGLIYCLLLILNIIVLLSGERTAFGLILIFNVLFLLKIVNLKKDFKILIFFITIFLSILIFNKSVYDRILKYTIFQMTKNEIRYLQIGDELNKFSLKNLKKPQYIFSKEHTAHYKKAYNIFLDNPYFGVGPKNFRNFCKKEKYKLPEKFLRGEKRIDYGCSTHPHNLIAQFLAETGILGVLFYILGLVYLLFNLIKQFKIITENSLKIYSLYVGVIINIFPFLPSGNFFNNWLSIILHLTIGLIIYEKSKYSTSH